MPNSNIKHLIIDRSGGSDLDHLHIEEMGKGFIFHPFSSDRHPIKFLNEDIHFTEGIKTKTLDLAYSRATPNELMDLFDNKNKNTLAYSKANGNGKLKTDQINNQKSEFIGLIDKTIHGIKEEKFQKVVVARNKTIELQYQFSSFEFFDSLSDQYGNAFVYMTFIPEVGSWMGATPET